ncbi:MAG: FMN-binding protein, partial [Spirochaetota bacterium]
EGNEIRAVDYDEYDADGNRKSLDSGYADRWSEQYPGMGPAMAIKQLEAQLVDGGSVDAVDGVSGATGTTSRFQAIAESALAGR